MGGNQRKLLFLIALLRVEHAFGLGPRAPSVPLAACARGGRPAGQCGGLPQLQGAAAGGAPATGGTAGPRDRGTAGDAGDAAMRAA